MKFKIVVRIGCGNVRWNCDPILITHANFRPNVMIRTGKTNHFLIGKCSGRAQGTIFCIGREGISLGWIFFVKMLTQTKQIVCDKLEKNEHEKPDFSRFLTLQPSDAGIGRFRSFSYSTAVSGSTNFSAMLKISLPKDSSWHVEL